VCQQVKQPSFRHVVSPEVHSGDKVVDQARRQRSPRYDRWTSDAASHPTLKLSEDDIESRIGCPGERRAHVGLIWVGSVTLAALRTHTTSRSFGCARRAANFVNDVCAVLPGLRMSSVQRPQGI